MSVRIAAPLAWTVWALSVTFAGLGLFLLFLNRNQGHLLDESLGVDAAVGFVFPTVGAIIASRRPGNVVGWLFCAIGLSGGAAVFFAEYGIYALATNPGTLPAGVAATWIGTWVWVPSVALTVTFLLLLFPHGRLLSPRWRPVAWLAAGATVMGIGIMAVVPWEVLEPNAPRENPFGLGAFEPVLLPLGVSALALFFASALLSALSLFLRFRRSQGVERQQLKWFVYAGVLSVVTIVLPGPGSAAAPVLQMMAIPLLAVAAGIAILRYRLYDIDLLINRTLVYGSLTAIFVLFYLCLVVSLQYALRTLTGQESQLAVVASTLAVAALFNPLRRRIQGFIDRRFYRRKYDSRKTLEAFSTKLRDETHLEALNADLVGVVRETMQPTHISVWLRPDSASKNDQQAH
jgi:hypothetical protein